MFQLSTFCQTRMRQHRGEKHDLDIQKEVREISTIVASIIVSAITAKIVATYYFKKVDGYVKEMCEMTNKNNEKTLSIVHKLQRNLHPNE